ncbi:Lar family restriction alleviation protein [Sinorhizobium meliloti]|uniref:Lar family restriction alleviation protein n=1 Tax=Rhizobium meliloti TaxID=382 RepID=UPI00398D50B3
MSENELKPCPFCGRPPHATKEIRSASLAALIMCSENGCVTMAGATLPDAIAAWNRRVPAIGEGSRVEDEAAEIIRGFLSCPEIADCAPEDLDNETRDLERRARRFLTASPERRDASKPFAWHTVDKHGCDYISRNEQNLRAIAADVGGEVTSLFASPPDGELVRMREAIDKVLAAEEEFRDIMPADWKGDPLSDAVSELRAALSSKEAK